MRAVKEVRGRGMRRAVKKSDEEGGERSEGEVIEISDEENGESSEGECGEDNKGVEEQEGIWNDRESSYRANSIVSNIYTDDSADSFKSSDDASVEVVCADTQYYTPILSETQDSYVVSETQVSEATCDETTEADKRSSMTPCKSDSYEYATDCFHVIYIYIFKCIFSDKTIWNVFKDTVMTKFKEAT